MAKSVIDIVINAVNKTKKGLTEPITDLKSLQSAVEKVGPAFKVAAVAAAGAIALLVKNQIDAADAFTDMSDRTGETIETLSTLSHAAEMSDTSMDAIEKTMGEISKKALLVAQGNKTAAAEFENVGVSALDAGGNARKGSEVIQDLSDKIRSGAITSEQAIQLMGKSSRELLPLMKSDMRELADEARALGLEISTGTAEAAATFNDNLDRLTKSNAGLINSFTAGLLPSLVQVSDGMVKSSQDGSILQGVMSGMGRAVGFVIRMFDAAFTGISAGLKLAGAGFAGLTQVLFRLAKRDFAGAQEAALELGHFVDKTLGEVKTSWEAAWNPELPKAAAKAAEVAIERTKVVNIEAIKEAEAARKKAAADAQKADEESIERLGELMRIMQEADEAIADIAEKTAEERKARIQEISDMERDLRLEGMEGYELDMEKARLQHTDRLRMIDELAEKGASEAEIKEARRLTLQSKEAADHAAAVKWLNERTNAQGAMTSGLVAGYKKFTDSSIDGNKRVEESMKAMWVTFRDQVVQALVWYTAQRIAQGAINAGVAFVEATALSKIWAAPALLAGVASGGTLPAVVGAELVLGAAVIPSLVAHGGLTKSAKEQTVFIDKGERILSPNQNADFTEFIEKGGGAGNMNLTINLDGEALYRGVGRATKDGRLTIDARSIKS